MASKNTDDNAIAKMIWRPETATMASTRIMCSSHTLPMAILIASIPDSRIPSCCHSYVLAAPA